eukprot:Hpha_TRINITY_DN16636_c3_g7::TRINITY_DN16636_c3_g7_i1::g.182099::m.182099/K16604/TTLL11; tubulin polyglutamylase TTLL11
MPGTGPLKVNSTNAHGTHDVLRVVAAASPREAKLIQTPCGDPSKGELLWVVTRDETEQRSAQIQGTNRWLSRIPGLADLCRKVPTAEALEPLRKAAPDDFSFVPPTWILPRDLDRVPDKGMLILKPDDGSQGDGIYLLDGKKDLLRKIRACGVSPDGSVVQRYISKPALLEGKKFDFRIYVTVFCDEKGGWEAALCREGLARVCADKYEAPTGRNLHRCTAHLTNYSLNVKSADYKLSDDGETGSKRLLSMAVRQINVDKPDWPVFDTLMDISALTVAALRREWLASAQPPSHPSFHVLGLDVLLDAKGGAHLLEINCNPSMVVTTPWPVAAVPPEAMQGAKTCRCMSHHHPHVHIESRVDLAAKTSVIGDTLRAIRKMKRGGATLPSALGDEFDSRSLLPLELGDAEQRVDRTGTEPASQPPVSRKPRVPITSRPTPRAVRAVPAVVSQLTR